MYWEIKANEKELYIRDLERLGNVAIYEITYYCACAKCCGKTDGITATGTHATEGRTIAVDPLRIPYGTEVYIENLGWRVAEDCGGGVKGRRIDVYVDSHEEALQRGRHTAFVVTRD